jgi:BMFP domain-containing protein YqiC
MLDPKKLEELAKQITSAIPPGVKSMAEGVEAKVKQVLQAQLTRMDFVSREEFEVQTQVLIRTREKLEALEARVATLESSTS